ncbi:type II secretion system protein N [Variovorax sp. dw_954]|uniref:type II secretion system protein N n=1 Tax=Variovorax sp. dw_954 TaxID=2720078 RepID=UPI001BD2344A|nr:type II secretion system protein N [Variovorax sp. dw_954]
MSVPSTLQAPFATSSRWPVALATLLVWGVAAASLVFWGLRLAAPADSAPPPAVASAPVTVDPTSVARFLGAVNTPVAAAATPDAASRFVLQGVIADTDGQGAALIAVDGKPARPFRVGASIGDSYVLQSVGARAASLGAVARGPVAFTLKLPDRPMAIPGVAGPASPAASSPGGFGSPGGPGSPGSPATFGGPARGP